jgi:membrane protein DedA with SNARE-associated domain
MNGLQLLSYLIEQYGLYSVFFLTLIEGDITLLLAGVLAHSDFFGDYSFARVLLWATLGAWASDNIAYAAGRGFAETVRTFRFYRSAMPRIERLTNRYGALSIFLSKYIYGLRWACCVFYGVGRTPYWRFLSLSAASCLVWVCLVSGVGYFFSSAVVGLIGDFRHVGKILLVVVIAGVLGVYLFKRLWISRKVEEVVPDKLQNIEQAAVEGLKELKEGIQEKIHRKTPRQRKRKRSKH